MAETQNDSHGGQRKAVEADGFPYRKGLSREGYAKGYAKMSSSEREGCWARPQRDED